MTKELINIAFCSDSNYIMPIGVAIISICENNKHSDLFFHVLMTDKDLDKEKISISRKPLLDIVKKYGQKISFYDFDFNKLAIFGDTQFGHISVATFVRLFITDILPLDIEKLLYLDGDIIVNGDLRELWNTPLEDSCPAAAVMDANSTSAFMHWAVKTQVSIPYVNAGVLLLNLCCWRKEEFSKKLIDCAIENLNHLPFLDQDLINMVFQGRMKILPIKYNFQTLFCFSSSNYWMVDYEYWDEIHSLVKNKDAVIIHYITANKPWKDEWCPMKDIWEKYKNMSVWKNDKPQRLSCRFDRCDIYEQFLEAYWADTKVMKSLLKSVMPLAVIIAKFRNKQSLINIVSLPLRLSTSILQKIYSYKTKH